MIMDLVLVAIGVELLLLGFLAGKLHELTHGVYRRAYEQANRGWKDSLELLNQIAKLGLIQPMRSQREIDMLERIKNRKAQ